MQFEKKSPVAYGNDKRQEKNNNLDKLYYNDFSLQKTENQNERTGNRQKRKHRKKRLQHHNLAIASLVQTSGMAADHAGIL